MPIFRELDPSGLAELDVERNVVSVVGGQILMREGEVADEMFIVISGRLHATVRDVRATRGERLIREFGPGDHLGELSMLTGRPRSATVRAIRDSELIVVSRRVFQRLIERHPKQLLHIAKALAARAQEDDSTTSHLPVRTIAVFPLTDPKDLVWLMDGLRRSLSEHDTCAIVWAPHGPSRPDSTEATHHASESLFQARLANLEADHRFVLFECDGEETRWTAQCMRQADRILAVAAAQAPLTPLGTSLLASRSRDLELVLIHRDGSSRPQTSKWLALAAFARHHHVARGAPRSGLSRLGRQLTGRAMGLVLGGGGARAYAHIGVIQALEESGFIIDRVGGTSLGAMIGGQYAVGYDVPAMIELNRRGWVDRQPPRDFAFPILSLYSGRSLTRAIELGFGSSRIEDFWLPFFCVTTNLTTGDLGVHERGPAAPLLRASLAIPGIYPPVANDRGELLVDGGVLNNLPVDVMRKSGRGPVVAVDVSPRGDRTLRGDERALAPTTLLWRLLRRAPERGRDPNILKVLQQITLLPSVHISRHLREQADLFLTPPVQSTGLFDWRALDRLIERARESTLERLSNWRSA